MIEGVNTAIGAATGAAITPATPTVTGSTGQAGALGTDASPGASDDTFGSLVKSAVKRLDRGQHQVEEEMARAVAGEAPDLHRTMVALQAEDLSFQLALQVRNKVIGAYEEIMRMQV